MAKRKRKRDYYEVLGVDRGADEAELKRAYRQLARKFHPDISGEAGAEDRFKEVNEAYAVLSDSDRRRRYDRFGFAGLDGEDLGGFGAVASAVDDLIGDFWRKRKQKERGRDLRYTLEVSLEEAASGCEKVITVPIGKESVEYVVKVPPGIADGAVRHLKGRGSTGVAGGSTGDLNVIIRVQSHPFFTREGDDLWCDVPVSFVQAALGDVIEVPSLTGLVKMRLPEGTQAGRVFRIRGRGFPGEGGKATGDQMVKVIVETPTALSPAQRQLLEQFAEATGNHIAHPQKRGFVDQLRTFFTE